MAFHNKNYMIFKNNIGEIQDVVSPRVTTICEIEEVSENHRLFYNFLILLLLHGILSLRCNGFSNLLSFI